MTTYGYARVSTDGQDHALQIDALVAAGVPANRIIEETASGAKARPFLTELSDNLESGDSLIVWKLDRIGRRASEIITLIDDLTARNVRLVILTLGLDTATPIGRMVVTILAGIAAFEREQTLERIQAGVQAAQARGVHTGRPHALTVHQRAEANRMRAAGDSLGKIAAQFNVSRMCVQRATKDKL